MGESTAAKNKGIVLEAFETLFNKRDYVAAERRFWSPNYIQHSAHIAPGREGLFNLIREFRLHSGQESPERSLFPSRRDSFRALLAVKGARRRA
jgi:predicted SnoaL-like aldol condensation-catalyzing enzyme